MKKPPGITKTYLRKNYRFFVCRKGEALDIDRACKLRGDWQFHDWLEYPEKTIYIYSRYRGRGNFRNGHFKPGTVGEAFAAAMMFNGN